MIHLSRLFWRARERSWNYVVEWSVRSDSTNPWRVILLPPMWYLLRQRKSGMIFVHLFWRCPLLPPPLRKNRLRKNRRNRLWNPQRNLIRTHPSSLALLFHVRRLFFLASLNSITQLHPITGVKRSDGLYPCTQWIKLGSCKYGSSCKFSHLSNDSSSSSDSTTLKSRKKSKPCFDFLDGRCERGDHCMYQHKALSEVSSKHRENFEISKIIHGKTFKSSEEKLEQIMKLPVSYRQRARRMFFSSTSMSSRSSAATSGSAVSS